MLRKPVQSLATKPIIIAAESNDFPVWIYFSFFNLIQSIVGILVIASSSFGGIRGLLAISLIMFLWPLMYLSIIIRDRIFVISDDGIEHVWIFRRNRTTKVDWPSVYRVYLHKRHGRYHSTTYIRVKYDGRTMTVPLYPHTTAILESFIGHIPSQSIDGRVVSFYKRVLKDYGPVP